MRPFTLLIKPTSADCNLRCEYCFYLEKSSLYPHTSRHRMPDAVLERMIQSYMATPQPVYSFAWQGGEPTLMGRDFFVKAVEWQKHYGRRGAHVGNGLQTNATLISDAMAQWFVQYHFLVGCSLDGPPALHDRYRRTIGGSPTHAEVMQGIETLQRHGVEVNILTLVSQANVNHARDVYRYLLQQGFHYQQYIPCVEFDDQGSLLPFAITGEEWGEFLCELFDLWYRKGTSSVSIRHFDAILLKLLDGQTNVCTMGRNCCQYFVVEHNGDVYPCDFFVEDRLKLGNVMEDSWDDMLNSPVYLEFGAQKSQWNEACAACEFLDVCAGDCLKHRLYAGQSAEQLSWLCAGWHRFFRYTRKRFEKLADRIRRQQRRKARAHPQSPKTARTKPKTVGRNDPCPCGSGRKYKKCCGA
jgi:uncharacterized protein